ncbi:MAG: hypothetical protein KJ558_03975 [Gammaproteobacteria bacterium]|nr:hypothetical protein [Gammaproteobacteria bacterium]MBU1653981.1 hypothetical protein [Gammaproteobacteria bacterium]MBU1960467.1 hypothetical protein [Gammaproteobacteria bacterium]
MTRISLSLMNMPRPAVVTLSVLSLLACLGAIAPAVADQSQGVWECRSGESGGWDCSWSGPGQPPQPVEHVNNQRPAGEQTSATVPAGGEGTATPAGDAAQADGQQSEASAGRKGPAITPIDEPGAMEPEKIGSEAPGVQKDNAPDDVAARVEAAATPPEGADKAEAQQEQRPSRVGRFRNWLGFGGEKKAEPDRVQEQPAAGVDKASSGEVASSPPTEATSESAKPQAAAKEIAPDIGVMDDPPMGVDQPAQASATTAAESGEKKSPSILGRMGGWLGLGGKKAPEPVTDLRMEKTEQRDEPGKVISDIGIKADNKR